MKEKLTLFLLAYAFLLFPSNCIKIDESENATTLEPLNSELKSENSTSGAQVTEDQFDNEENISVTTSSSHIHKIPPTLHNAKTSEKTPKDILKPTSANIHIPQVLPDGKLKQAIINTKQQIFKNLEKSNKLKDQVRQENRPAQVQTEEKQEALPPPAPSPTAKEFVPSPELNIFSSDIQLPDHFHPMKQYYHHQPQNDVYFPQSENQLNNAFNPIINTQWFGGNKPQMNDHHPRSPEGYSYFPTQHGIRNTNVDFSQFYHDDRHISFPHQQFQHQRPFTHPLRGELTGERMVFPTDNIPLTMEEPAFPTKQSGVAITERSKGTWKWIPDSDEELQNFDTRGKFTQFDLQRFKTTTRDRPYSFESSDVFTQQTTPPSASPSFLGTGWRTGSSEAEEVNTGRPEDSEKLDVKLLRSPSPWKRIVHVMSAAIPIGLLISALTPRFVYVHPNATAPSIPQPLLQQQPPPPIANNNPPSNAPSPLRQRALFNYDAEIDHFLKIIDMQYRAKHRGQRTDIMCEDKFFCEIALMGARLGASRMHKTLYHVALETPKAQAEKSGLSEIFTAVQRQNCNVFKCKKA